MIIKNLQARLVGNCSVDSGTLMVGDPCYYLHTEDNERFHKEFGSDWDDFVHNKLFKNGKDAPPEDTIGGDSAVLLNDIPGDGTYSVYELLGEDGDVVGYFVETSWPERIWEEEESDSWDDSDAEGYGG